MESEVSGGPRGCHERKAHGVRGRRGVAVSVCCFSELIRVNHFVSVTLMSLFAIIIMYQA